MRNKMGLKQRKHINNNSPTVEPKIYQYHKNHGVNQLIEISNDN